MEEQHDEIYTEFVNQTYLHALNETLLDFEKMVRNFAHLPPGPDHDEIRPLVQLAQAATQVMREAFDKHEMEQAARVQKLLATAIIQDT